jgi:hypothetical protein
MRTRSIFCLLLIISLPLSLLAQGPVPPPPPDGVPASGSGITGGGNVGSNPRGSTIVGNSELSEILSSIFGLLNTIVVLLMLLATVVFIWGLVKYLFSGGDEDAIKEARQLIIWGIISLSVMVAAWGFVNVIIDFFFATDTEGLLQGEGAIPRGPQQDNF